MQLKGASLTELFQGGYVAEPEEEARRIKTSIVHFIRLYTFALEAIEHKHLRNHISYWLLLSTLLETGMIVELEELNMEMQQDCSSKEDEEQFFIFENSLGVLCKYLLKLSQWYHDTIQLFYYQLLNLYYYYDPARTHSILKEKMKAKIDLGGPGLNSATRLFAKDYKPMSQDAILPLSKAEEAAQIAPPQDNESFFFSNHTRGQVWVILGLTKLMQCEDPQVRGSAARYVSEYQMELITLLNCTVPRYLSRTLTQGKLNPVPYEFTMDFQTHYYDFFYILDGFIDLAGGTVDLHFDDALLGCL
jgi:hypothetical protein